MTVQYKTFTFTVQPGAILAVNRNADFVTCFDANAAFVASFDANPEFDFEKGLTIEPDVEFKQVKIRNLSSTDELVVKLGFGRGNVRDSRLVLPASGLSVFNQPGETLAVSIQEFTTTRAYGPTEEVGTSGVFRINNEVEVTAIIDGSIPQDPLRKSIILRLEEITAASLVVNLYAGDGAFLFSEYPYLTLTAADVGNNIVIEGGSAINIRTSDANGAKLSVHEVVYG